MKKIIIGLLLLLLLAGCQSVTLSADVESLTFQEALSTKTIGLSVFNLSGTNSSNANIRIYDADFIKVEATFNKELLDYGFEIGLKDDAIVIKTDHQDGFSNLKLNVDIYGPIDKIKLEGAYHLIYQKVGVEDLLLNLDGAGKVELLNIDIQSLDLVLEGATHVIASGKAESLHIQLEGAGSVEAFDLISQQGNVSLEGAGSIEVYVTENLNASLEGLGSIEYKGNPSIQASVNGLGSIEEAD